VLTQVEIGPKNRRMPFTGALPIEITLKNVGINPCTVSFSVDYPEDSDLTSHISLGAKEITVEQAAQEILAVKVGTEVIGDRQECEIRIGYKSNAANDPAGQIVFILERAPAPVVERICDAGEVWSNQRKKVALTVGNSGGGILKLAGPVESSERWVEVQSADVAVSPGERVPIAASIDPASLPAGDHSCAVSLRFVGIAEPAVVDVKVRVRKAPAIKPDPAHLSLDETPEGRVRPATIALGNEGEGKIRITKICPADGWVEVDEGTLRSLAETPLAGDAGASLNLRVTAPMLAEGAEVGEFNSVLRVEYEVEEGPEKEGTREIPLTISVFRMEEFGGPVGIDFGTTNSCIAVWQGEFPEILEVGDKDKSPFMPSIAYWKGGGDYVIGQAAKDSMAAYPERIFRSIKRIIEKQNVVIIEGEKVDPRDVAAAIIRKLLETAEEKLKARITSAIITVPANFTDVQIQGLMHACRKCGLKINEDQEAILDEPSAAAFAYIYGEQVELKREKTHFLIYDFGGGTLDVSILEVYKEAGGRVRMGILASKGNNRMGGDDLDYILASRIGEEVKGIYPEFDLDLLISPRGRFYSGFRRKCGGMPARERAERRGRCMQMRQEFKEVSEKAKTDLSDLEAVVIHLFEAPEGKGLCLRRLLDTNGRDVKRDPKKDASIRIKRSEFEKLIEDKVNTTGELIRRSCNLAGLRIEDIEVILLTGQTSRIPYIMRKVSEFVPKARVETVEPKLCVAKGAAWRHATMNLPGTGRVEFEERGKKTTYRYGIKEGGVPNIRFSEVIPEGAPYPTAEPVVRSIPAEHIGVHGVMVEVLQNDSSDNSIFVKDKATGKLTANKGIRRLGNIYLTKAGTETDGVPGCVVAFEITVNRVLRATADGLPIDIKPDAGNAENEEWP